MGKSLLNVLVPTTLALCHGLGAPASPPEKPRSWPTKGWQTSSPEAQGMDSSELAGLVDFGGSQGMDSVLVVRHGKIVAEAYYAPFTSGIKHRINSATKAVVGTLVGIALEDGLLKSPDQSVLDFFADRTVANLDERKKALSIRSLLDMTS